jgi:hypothetical protein
VEEKYNWVAWLAGPEQRRYFFVGFPYKRIERAQRSAVMSDSLGSKEAQGVRGAVCIGQDVEKDDYPYSVIAGSRETQLLE